MLKNGEEYKKDPLWLQPQEVRQKGIYRNYYVNNYVNFITRIGECQDVYT